MTENQYKFFNEVSFHEAYNMSKLQFQKIIKDFNKKEFEKNFKQLFYGGRSHTLFLKRGDDLICGSLSLLIKNAAFVDIFFWNILSFQVKEHELRLMCDKLISEIQQKEINYLVIPLDKNRLKYEKFKNWCQKFFFSEDKCDMSSSEFCIEYKNHFLLKVSCENYLKKTEELALKPLQAESQKSVI